MLLGSRCNPNKWRISEQKKGISSMPLLRWHSVLIMPCRGVCRGWLVISQVSIQSLMKESVRRDITSGQPPSQHGPWCSGQAGECGLCVESASSHTIVYPFRSQIQTLRCLNLRLLNNWELSPLLIRNILTGMTLSEHDYHIVSTWHVSVWTQVPIDRSPHWSLSSLLSLTIGCPDICQWPGVARGRVQ